MMEKGQTQRAMNGDAMERKSKQVAKKVVLLCGERVFWKEPASAALTLGSTSLCCEVVRLSIAPMN